MCGAMRMLLGGAGGALILVADVAKHVAWYVSHRIEPQPRARPAEPERA
jgi:hypothetical protein